MIGSISFRSTACKRGYETHLLLGPFRADGVFQTLRDQRRPARLVARAQTGTRLAVEILVEKQSVPAIRPRYGVSFVHPGKDAGPLRRAGTA